MAEYEADQTQTHLLTPQGIKVDAQERLYTAIPGGPTINMITPTKQEPAILKYWREENHNRAAGMET